MSNSEVVELFSLYVCLKLNRPASWKTILDAIRINEFPTFNVDQRDYPGLPQDLVTAGFVKSDQVGYSILPSGLTRLRFLCGQPFSSFVSPTGLICIEKYRRTYDSWRAKELKNHTSLRIAHDREIHCPNLATITLLEEAGETPPYNSLGRARYDRSRGNYNVYVIELNDSSRANFPHPTYPGKPHFPCVYVGATGLTPEGRYKVHIAGKEKFSKVVNEHHIRLLPALYEDYNPLDKWGIAEKVEPALAKKLNELGFTVHGAPILSSTGGPGIIHF